MTVALAHDGFGTEAGSGAPDLVILHGLFGSARNWGSLARRFAATHRVHALDLRNHGRSGWADAMTYPDLAGDVRAFMAGQGIGRAVVLGHSVGGKTAMLLALKHPEQVAALIVVDIAPDNYPHGFIDYVRAMQGVDLAALDRRAAVDAALGVRITDPNDRSFMMQNLETADGRMRWRVNLAAISSNMGELIDFPPEVIDLAYDGPTLFVAGERSDYVLPEHHAAIRDMFPAARIELIPDAGHQVHADQPERFFEAVNAFLAEVAG